MRLERQNKDDASERAALLLIGSCATDIELRQLVQDFDWTAVGRADTDVDGLTSLRVRPRTVVVLDRNVPVLGGVTFLRNMRRQKLNAQVLMRGAEADTTEILDALRAGAAGYLRQTASVHELVQAVGCVARGSHYLEADVAQTLALQIIGNLRFPSPKHRLRNDAGDDGCARL
jgi:DNA-binding NarL/FixJ family response regulator